MALAAILAFAICRWLGLHRGFFAVITALLTVRAGGGNLLDRLVGIGAGIGVALALSWLVRYHVPPTVLVALAMLPLCYLVARYRKYQIAPIIAIVVLSAGMMMNSALNFLLTRLIEVGIGFCVGTLVSLLVFRRTLDRRSRQHAADMLRGCGALFTAAVTLRGAGRDQGLRTQLRNDLRLVSVTSPVASGPGRRIRRNHILAMQRLQLDLMFVHQALTDLKLAWRARARATLDHLAHGFETLCREGATALLTDGPAPDFGAFDTAVRALNGLRAVSGMPLGNDANLALPFLLMRLRADLYEILAFYTITTLGQDTDLDADHSENSVPALTAAAWD